MAVEDEITNLVDLTKVFQLSSSLSDVSRIIAGPGALASAFSIVGVILGFSGNFLPDRKHERILREFRELSYKIDLLRNDLRDLENMLKLDIMELHYKAPVERIEYGIRLCLQIGRATGTNQTMQHQNRLKRLCDGERCSLDLETLLNGMIGTKLFEGGHVLEKFYAITGGNRIRLAALSTRLLQLICRSMIVVSAYDTMMYGKEITEGAMLTSISRLNEAIQKVHFELERCVNDFKTNMLNDLNRFLDQGGSNDGLVTEISNFMRDKYDWLENFCLVYNDMHGWENHCIGGQRVNSLHRNGKCGVVYYRTKGAQPRFSHKYNRADDIAYWLFTANARWHYDKVVARLNEEGIGFSGCAIIKGESGIRSRGTFSTKIVNENKDTYEGWLWASSTYRTQTIILLE